jgi:hypothetical protein
MKSRRVVWVLLVVLAGLAVYVGNVLATPATPATPAPGFTGKTLAMGTFGEIDSHMISLPSRWLEIIKTKGLSDLYVQQNTWDPSPSTGCGCTPTTGWHTHSGPSLIIVTQGSVTAYDGDDPTCKPHVYTANTPNSTFVDPGGGHVHIIRDESGAVAQTIAVQLIPAGATRRQDAPDPKNCPF